MKIKKLKTGRPSRDAEKTESVKKQIRIKMHIFNQLQEICDEQNLPLGSVINHFIEQGLKQIQEAK